MTFAIETLPAWLAPHAPLVQQLLVAARAGSIMDALNAVRGESMRALQFVPHSALPDGEAYEAFIARTNCIPTRENSHDLFNGLVWLRYPQTKRRLNALQAQEIAEHGTTGPRGALRDALTIFDENAALLRAPAPLLEALRAREWTKLFIEQRALWQSAELVLFGHALLEKLLQPRKAITAHVWMVAAVTDDVVARSLTRERLVARSFLPLPVLGVPGWWAGNEVSGFYDDPEVFRVHPRRPA